MVALVIVVVVVLMVIEVCEVASVALCQMATLYHSFAPSPPCRNDLHHQKIQMMRNHRRSRR